MFTADYTGCSSPTTASVCHDWHDTREQSTSGLIREIVYAEDQQMVAQYLLLPLLQQLSKQSRWQLWVTPRQKISREWIRSSGLPLTKVMQTGQHFPCDTLNSMIRALYTGNYSVVIGWLSDDLTPEEHKRLVIAAEQGHATGLIMRPVNNVNQPDKKFTELKTHSILCH